MFAPRFVFLLSLLIVLLFQIALRFAIQLHLDFVEMGSNDADVANDELFDALQLYEPQARRYVICDESDAQWRTAILNNVENLVSVRSEVTPSSFCYLCV